MDNLTHEQKIKLIEQNKCLDVFIDDENENIRYEVAMRGYGLSQLINDKSWFVRCAVAEQNYGLNILVNDENVYVRREVAKQGYKLLQLINDKYSIVINEVLRYCREHQNIPECKNILSLYNI